MECRYIPLPLIKDRVISDILSVIPHIAVKLEQCNVMGMLLLDRNIIVIIYIYTVY